jgi:uncharacterized SAM-binding protein YcdF (DUF218 family)
MKKTGFHVFNFLISAFAIAAIFQSFSAHSVSAGWDLGLLLPAVSGVFLLLLAAIRWSRGRRMLMNPVLQRKTRIVLSFGLLVFLLVEGLLISDPYVHGKAGFMEQAAGSNQWLVVLGCGIKADGTPTWALENRLDEALDWYQAHPGTRLVVSGGKGPNEPVPEAVSMASYLVSRGALGKDVLIEDRSSSTMENFRYSRILMEKAGWDGSPILFVTNDFHVFRARILASRNGFTAFGIGAPTPAVIWPNVYLREFFALFKSLAVDRIP